MSALFEDLKEGLEQAIDYANGNGTSRTVTYTILPVTEYDRKQIREIRMKANMTQQVFASFLGVSVKTVEAWETGRTHPSGPAYRLMYLLSNNQSQRLPFLLTE